MRLLLLLVLLIGCTGEIGPTGPQGAQGNQGPAGPGTRLTFAGQLNIIGTAVVLLPAEAGTIQDPPAVTCYISDRQAGPYVILAWDASTGERCQIQQNLAGNLEVGLVSVAFWYYRVVVIY